MHETIKTYGRLAAKLLDLLWYKYEVQYCCRFLSCGSRAGPKTYIPRRMGN